jgi:polyphosphate kinase
LFVDEEEIEDLARALEGELMERGFAEAVRLEVATNCPENIARFLASKFGIEDGDIYRCDGPVNLNRMSAICDLADRPGPEVSAVPAAHTQGLVAGRQPVRRDSSS